MMKVFHWSVFLHTGTCSSFTYPGRLFYFYYPGFYLVIYKLLKNCSVMLMYCITLEQYAALVPEHRAVPDERGGVPGDRVRQDVLLPQVQRMEGDD